MVDKAPKLPEETRDEQRCYLSERMLSTNILDEKPLYMLRLIH